MSSATATVETDSEKPKEVKETGSMTLGLYEVEKIGKREKGTAAVKYDTWQIDEWKASDPASLVNEALSFLDGNFDHLKDALKNGANQKRRFLDAPGSDPFEQIIRFMQKKGITPEAFLDKIASK